jgi:hypothetical protein
MKVAYLAENLGTVRQPWTLSAKELMRRTGENIGNLAFWNAARLLFDAEPHLVGWHTRKSELPDDIAALVIPAANFIHGDITLTPLVELVRAVDKPVFLLGIGAQAEREDEPLTPGPGVLEFLQEVSARTPTICLRGDFTQRVCEGFGIGNTQVLGCPSILTNPDPNLGRTLAARIARIGDGPVSVAAACVKGQLRSVERELMRLVQLRPGSGYVVQRPIEFIKIIRGEDLTEQEASDFQRAAAFYDLPGGRVALASFLRIAGYVPDSVDSWLHWQQRFSASVNTRIHGTVMSVMAGVPGICIGHDTRTTELAKRLRLPLLSMQAFIGSRYSLRDQFAESGFSGEAFDQNRAETAAAYVRILAEIGLPPSRHLLSLAAAAAAPVAPPAETAPAAPEAPPVARAEPSPPAHAAEVPFPPERGPGLRTATAGGRRDSLAAVL